jgi:hypothetical protein
LAFPVRLLVWPSVWSAMLVQAVLGSNYNGYVCFRKGSA